MRTVTDRHLAITGASSGIGRHTVLALADGFERITLIGRSVPRHEAVVDELRALGHDPHLLECDLTSLGEVGRVAAAIDSPLSVVVANAGVAGGRGVTQDGFELHFGVNHLAHHLLVTELLDSISDRVVTVSSNAHLDAEGVDLAAVRGRTRSLTGFPEYRASKLANVWFGRELARRSTIASYVVHPGLAATDIWRRIPWPVRPLLTRRMASPQEGAQTSIWAATADGLESGGYYVRCAPRPPSGSALDQTAASELWERSEEWVEPFRRRGT